MNNEYKTLEQQIMSLWKSRGMEVHIIKFKTLKNQYQWTITVDRKSEGK